MGCSLRTRPGRPRSETFLKTEFPKAFGKARVRAYGFPGIRQTRWIRAAGSSSRSRTLSPGRKFDDAIARTAWPIELHESTRQRPCLAAVRRRPHALCSVRQPHRQPDADNIVVAGRCIDADNAALSSVRVMGPCIAMGAAAAHALDLAGTGSVHQIDSGSPEGSPARQSRAQCQWTRDCPHYSPLCRSERLIMKLTDDEKACWTAAKGPAKAKGDGSFWCATGRRWARTAGRGQERLRYLGSPRGPIMRDYAARGRTRSFPNSTSTAPKGWRRRHGCPTPAIWCGHRQHAPGRSRAFRRRKARDSGGGRKFFGATGVQHVATCTPYQVGNVPVWANILPGSSPPRSSIATPCSAPGPTPRDARAPARRASPAASPTWDCTPRSVACRFSRGGGEAPG